MFKLLSHLWCFLFRWRVVRLDHPVPTPCVVIGAPHTSNWDFFAMLATARLNGVRIKWLGKREMFDGPLGPLFRALGGVSVDRKKSGGLVGEMAKLLQRSPDLAIVIPAEGTRDPVDYWRSGFYNIASEAQVPIQLTWVDRNTRTSGFGPSFLPSGDVRADMDRVRTFYEDKEGIRPGRFKVPRLREEDAVESRSATPTDPDDSSTEPGAGS